MIIGKKVLMGALGVGAAAAALGWMLLPRDSKIRKMLAGKAKEVGGAIKGHVDDIINVTSDKKSRPAPVRRNRV